MTDERLIEEAEQGNRATEAREHRRLFEAAAREQLIAKAATAILAREGIEPQEDGTYWGENTWPNAVKDATTALAVFEKAHTPTDDELEALARIIEKVFLTTPHGARRYAEEIVAMPEWPFRRSEVPEPSGEASPRCGCSCHTMPGVEHIVPCCYPEPQGEPSDAQALLAIRDDIVRNGGRADAAVLAGLEALAMRAANNIR